MKSTAALPFRQRPAAPTLGQTWTRARTRQALLKLADLPADTLAIVVEHAVECRRCAETIAQPRRDGAR